MLDVKKTLAKVINMFREPFTLRTVSVVGNTRGLMGTATAPSVAGYKFVCWVCVYSNGWVGSPYAAGPTNITTDIWSPSYDQAGYLTANCVALYHKVGGVARKLLKALKSLAFKGVVLC